jgi:hypothetical protein
MKTFTPFLHALLVLVVLAAASASAGAGEIFTKKFPWQPQKGQQELDWKTESGVRVQQITFDLGDILKPIHYSTARATLVVDNDSGADQVVGIAVAIFDGEDHLVAAGDGGVKLGTLGKWKRDTFMVGFPHVFRHINDAKYFLITIETK